MWTRALGDLVPMTPQSGGGNINPTEALVSADAGVLGAGVMGNASGGGTVGGGDTQLPAGTPRESRATGAPLGPITLVPPMPSMTPPHPQAASLEDLSPACAVNQWAVRHPLFAVLAAAVVFTMFRGGRR